MNRTTVKRGIGAVILALIAAALLAFLLKDKAAHRQEVVEISLPGTEGSVNSSDQATRLPTLTTDNSEGGSVIANAGSGAGSTSASAGTGTSATDTGNADSASGNNPDGTIIASAAAVGTAAATGVAASANGTANAAAKNIDFSVKPKAASKSSEFLDLDLVNNGQSNSTAASSAGNSAAAAASVSTATATDQSVAPKSAGDSNTTDQGIVIASTAPKSGGSNASAVQPRLIGEKRSAPVKSANTAKVVTKKKAPAKASTATTSNTSSAGNARNGYAIQLLATSSQARANSLKKVMAGEGYPTYVTKTKQNGKTLYRVRIGQYAKKSDAVKAQSSMKRRYKKNTNVNRSAVVAR